MSSEKKPTPFEDVFKRADVVIDSVAPRGGLSATGVLASRGWFDARRRKLKSSGGRPTNPDWALKRQVPFAPETWERLKAIADDWSEPGTAVGPGQVAAFLLEDILSDREPARPTPVRLPPTKQPDDCDSSRFRRWKMPAPFAGRAP